MFCEPNLSDLRIAPKQTATLLCGPAAPLSLVLIAGDPPSLCRMLKLASSSVSLPSSNMSFQAKIQRSANAPRAAPSEIEQQIAQALLDLEQNVPELKTELRQLQISSAKEVDAKGGKKAVVIFVPVPQVKAFHTVQQR